MPRVYDKDPYVILGVPTTATVSQVKEAYHRLARQFHPDLNKDLRAADRMKDINWAYDILGDPYERSLYEAWRAATFRAASQPRPNPAPRYSPPPTYGTSTRTSPPRTATVGKVTQSQARGCSWVSVTWVALMLILNILRAPTRSTSNFPVYSVNAATQTAQMEALMPIFETFQAVEEISTQQTTVTSQPFRQTPIATALRDEFGREDLRARVVPGSKEWEWLNTYFPGYHLTTPEGVSEEVTFVYWDQVQRAIVVETQQSGTFFFVIGFNGQVTAGHTGPASPTPAESSPAPVP